MRYQQLWAPWRLTYIKGQPEDRKLPERDLTFLPGADPDCFLCRAVADRADRENLIVYRDSHTIVMLNRYPYNNGHLLVAPPLHKGRLDELTEDDHLGVQQTITMFVGLLQRLMNAEGFNIGLNLGHVAGAGLPGHLHWHIVPRWNGDTNFMAAVGDVKVIPQALDALWTLLDEALAQGKEKPE